MRYPETLWNPVELLIERVAELKRRIDNSASDKKSAEDAVAECDRDIAQLVARLKETEAAIAALTSVKD